MIFTEINADRQTEREIKRCRQSERATDRQEAISDRGRVSEGDTDGESE